MVELMTASSITGDETLGLTVIQGGKSSKLSLDDLVSVNFKDELIAESTKTLKESKYKILRDKTFKDDYDIAISKLGSKKILLKAIQNNGCLVILHIQGHVELFLEDKDTLLVKSDSSFEVFAHWHNTTHSKKASESKQAKSVKVFFNSLAENSFEIY